MPDDIAPTGKLTGDGPSVAECNPKEHPYLWDSLLEGAGEIPLIDESTVQESSIDDYERPNPDEGNKSPAISEGTEDFLRNNDGDEEQSSLGKDDPEWNPSEEESDSDDRNTGEAKINPVNGSGERRSLRNRHKASLNASKGKGNLVSPTPNKVKPTPNKVVDVSTKSRASPEKKKRKRKTDVHRVLQF